LAKDAEDLHFCGAGKHAHAAAVRKAGQKLEKNRQSAFSIQHSAKAKAKTTPKLLSF